MEFHLDLLGMLSMRSSFLHLKNMDRRTKWSEKDRESENRRKRLWNSSHSDYVRDYQRKYRDTHLKIRTDDTRLKERMYIKNRKKHDLNFRIRNLIRDRFRKAFRRGGSSSLRYLGCSIEELKKYLESKFVGDMSWDNYGRFGWHIDHIRPLCSFDLTDPRQLSQACHYTNLQPLMWKDNLSKGKSYPQDTQ